MIEKKKIIFLLIGMIAFWILAVIGYNYLIKEYNKKEEKTQLNGNQITNMDSTIEEKNNTNSKVAPNITVYTNQGEPVQLWDLKGKPVVMNFWATWCGYCKKEMPDFNEVYEQEKENVTFLMINMTDERETKQIASNYIKQGNFTFPVYYDITMDAVYTYGIYSLPTTVFIDKEGNIDTIYHGMLTKEALKSHIERIKK